MKLAMFPTTTAGIAAELTAAETRLGADIFVDGAIDIDVLDESELRWFFCCGDLETKEIRRVLQLLSDVKVVQEIEDPQDRKLATALTLSKCLQKTAKDTAYNLAALGKDAFADHETAGLIEDALANVRTALRGLNQKLEARAAANVERQLKQLNLDRGQIERGELKLHVGSGGESFVVSHDFPGWIDIDLPKMNRTRAPQLALDVRKGLPFPDNCAKYVYTYGMIEHLYYRDEVLNLFREFRRVLRPGGIARISVPDAEWVIKRWWAGGESFESESGLRKVMDGGFETKLAATMVYLGANNRWVFGHKFAYDFETMESLFRSAGFTKVTRSSHQASEHPELRVDPFTATNIPALMVEAE